MKNIFPQNPVFSSIHGKLRSAFPFLLALFAILISCQGVSAEKPDGRECFRKGKSDLDAGRYEEAVRNLTMARQEFALLGDYASLYLSEAYHKMQDHDKSLAAVRTLLAEYPLSTLVKKARVIEIREAREQEAGDLLLLYETYLRDYPDDEDMQLQYGLFLRQAGEMSKAAGVFKQLYRRAGALSHSAYAEIGPGEIQAQDVIERASNLTKKHEFKEAERDLRKALSADDGKNRDEILRNLGYALFKQKEYKEAAVVYESVKDSYFKARSLYRAGDKEGFELALGDLLSRGDHRAGLLLIAAASDKRRERDFDGAIKIYDNVLKHYPSETEDALWGIGWTYYVSGDFRKSSGAFSKLYVKYEDPRYLYWQARSIEALGEDAKDLYQSLTRHENNFYSAMAQLRNKVSAGRKAHQDEALVSLPSEKQQFGDRVLALQSLGMIKEAVTELSCLVKKADTPAELLYVISKFQELGEYRRAIGLAVRMPYSEKLHKFWYPLAFWDDVEKISGKYDLDPFVALSVMREESRFDAEARSAAGARGLMQVMPQTAYHLDKSIRLGISRESQINDVRNNIHLGAYYLKSLLNEFRALPQVLAAYNAGELAVRRWEQSGNYRSADEFIEDIPFVETRNYVKKVLNSYFQYKRTTGSDLSWENVGVILGRL